MLSTRQVLVSVASKFNDVLFSYKNEAGEIASVYKVPEKDINWDVTVTGVVEVECPKIDLKKGDEIAFSYQVIASKKWNTRNDVFQQTVDSPGVLLEWTDGVGNTLRKVKSFFARKWDGFLLDKKKNLISHMSGDESKVDRFISQFNFSSDKGKFVNLLNIDGKEYWKVTPNHLIAVKTDKGIKTFNNKVLVRKLEVDVTQAVELAGGIILPDNYVKHVYPNRGVLVNDYDNLELLGGDIIGFEERLAEKYILWGQEYFLVKENRVLGVFKEIL